MKAEIELQGLSQDLGHRVPRVKGRVRILENELNASQQIFRPLIDRVVQTLGPRELDGSVQRRPKAGDGPKDPRLAASGFTNQPKAFPSAND